MTLTDTTPQPRRRGRPRRARSLSAREYLAYLKREHPDATPAEIAEHYKQHIRDNTLFDDAEVERHNMEPLSDWLRTELETGTNRGRARSTPEARQRRHEEKQAIVSGILAKDNERIEAVVMIRLLEHVTPNGMKLADLTGAQCRGLGGFYAEVSKRLRPREHVGNHLTEQELQGIARTYRLGAEAAR